MATGELESIRQADSEIRTHIEEFVQQPDISMVKHELEHLLDEYLESITSVEKIQKLIGDQLRDVKRGNHVANEYQSVMKPAVV